MPEWCELIASGKKTVEVRKTKPKLETPFKCYIYCTKGRGDCLWRWDGGVWYDTQFPNERPNRLDGKVIGEFVCNTIFDLHEAALFAGMTETTDSVIAEFSCLSVDELLQYKGVKNEIYGWSISDLKIYDKPRALSEFEKPHDYIDQSYRKRNSLFKGITRPPQSWCYVESEGEG